jgi:hypothetical protein
MTQPRDIDRLLDLWLSDGSSVAPDRVLDVVADRIDRQPQRPAWRLDRRLSTLNTYAKIAVAAAVLIVAVIGYNLLPGSSSVGGPPPNATPLPTASPLPSPTAAAAAGVTMVDPAAPGSDIPTAFLGTYTEGEWAALPTGDDRYSWQLLPAGDKTCAELVHVTTSCIVITRQPSDVEQYGPAAVVGDLLYYRMIVHNFQEDPCLNKVSVWRLRVLADRLTTAQMDPGCRNSLDDAGFLLRANP